MAMEFGLVVSFWCNVKGTSSIPVHVYSSTSPGMGQSIAPVPVPVLEYTCTTRVLKYVCDKCPLCLGRASRVHYGHMNQECAGTDNGTELGWQWKLA